ncbi:hypothetical protein N7478_005142 [Penicillium angulare]|uniref:uncharacterized protein n=1 Tax=Penicillium angulare TaxID=116970 RepID=UPI002540AA11|nr:uncharacterized protein N7478_005142 [Penicillium angulare]KAJ5279770.1 hypothetical protein N7478_005142 [Penicillium angulare]
MAEKSFRPFPRLPTELRLEIWRLCLPYRVWEVDHPTYEGICEGLGLKANAEGLYPCQLLSSAILNALPPVISRVCQESRHVAHESGGIMPEDFHDDLPDDDEFIPGTSTAFLDNFWIDRTRDSAHLNWGPSYQAIYQRSDGSALACFAWQCRQVAGRPSLMADWFAWSRSLYKERYNVLEDIPNCWVIMRVVIIHTSFEEGAQTGLFGLLGDATVQIVSVFDREKIDAFYDFADEQNSQAFSVTRFSHTTPGSWKQKLEKSAKSARISEKVLSKMHPAIMFRLCTSRCNSPREKGPSAE